MALLLGTGMNMHAERAVVDRYVATGVVGQCVGSGTVN